MASGVLLRQFVEKYKFSHILNQEQKRVLCVGWPHPAAASLKNLPRQALPPPPDPRWGFADT